MTLKINKKEYYKMNDSWITLLVNMAIGAELMVLKTQNEQRALDIYTQSIILVKEMSEDEKYKGKPKEFIADASKVLQYFYSEKVAEDLLNLLENGFPKKKTIIEPEKKIIQ